MKLIGRSLILVFSLLLFVSAVADSAAPGKEAAKPAAAAAAKVVELKEIRKPPKEFVDAGEFAGVSAANLAKLGVEEGAIILVKTGDAVIAAQAKAHGEGDAIYLKESLRTALGAEEGPQSVKIAACVWPSGAPLKTAIAFSQVVRPTRVFIEEQKNSVGLPYSAFKELGVAPGAKGIVSANGKKTAVTLQLLERGKASISMGKVIRDRLGIEEGAVEVKLDLAPAKAAAEPTPTAEPGDLN